MYFYTPNSYIIVMTTNDFSKTKLKWKRNGLLAVSPMLVLIICFLGLGVGFNDFYKVPLLLVFIFTTAYALLITRGHTMQERINYFSRGAGSKNLLFMVWIFVLAGAFASSAKAMGAIDATVDFTLALFPQSMLLPGIFITACFVSMSIGTSVGTIVALTPIATGLSSQVGIELPLLVSATIGGALFGDNLSFISDTTIAATRTQGCKLKDKFKVNIRIATPAALLTALLYAVMGQMESGISLPSVTIDFSTFLNMLPYIAVLVMALLGVDVLIVLFVGVFLTGVIGVCAEHFTVLEWMTASANGIAGMGELILISMIAGGLLELIRVNGGITYIMHRLTRKVNTLKGGEVCIAMLVSLTNLCTANNTIAILSVGKIANDIAERFNIDKRRSASILDTFSCIVQSFIPYGAQLLIAAGLASISPVEIIPYLYYPMLLLLMSSLAIVFGYPKLK